jgi:NodT family efflux transporter outer membrane factor (OMF) lipoprotein
MLDPFPRGAARARLALVGAAAALVAGCTLGPDFLRPAAPKVDGYTAEPLAPETNSAPVAAGEAQRFVGDLDIPGQWWTLFHSAELDRLIEQALAANPNLSAAQAALRQARENVYAGEGAYFPTVTANGSAAREKASGAELGVPTSSTFSLATAALNVSYNVDVFGGTRRQIESLKAQEDYQRYQLEATYLSLTSNLVVAAINEASLRGQIAATEDIVTIETDSLRVLQSQFELGGASKVAVLAQAATLAQTRATLPPLQKQLAQQRNQLAALIGSYPSEDRGEPFHLADLQLPRELPVSLPSKLLDQRPDVRAAEAQLHSASAQIGVALANELPQFNITGSLGSTALGFAGLFGPGAGVWSIAGSVAQTLFDGGTLLHRERAAVAAFDQSAELYRATVITAVQNVADALRALQTDADAVNAQATAVQTAFDSLEITRQQFQTGAITYLSLLTAQQTYQQSRIGLVQAQGNRYADTAALFQALGGGWWHRTDVVATTSGADRFALPLPTP